MSSIHKKITELPAETRELFELLLDREGFAVRQSLILPRRERSDASPLSFAQQRLYFLDQLEPGSSVYNIATAVRFEGSLNVEALEYSIGEVVRRHEALRTVFRLAGVEPMQVVTEPRPLAMPTVRLDALPEHEREAEVERLLFEESRRPFDLSRGPLLRITLLRLSDDEHIFLLTVHHIAADGWSLGVLVREVAALYEAFLSSRPSPLPELPIQYADYAHWQRGRLRGDALERLLAFWRKRLEGSPPVLELPADRERPSVQTFRGTVRSLVLSETLSASVKALAAREGATLFMVLLAAFKALLHRYTGQEDILVGTGVSGRNGLETESLIGFFVNLLVLRTNVAGDPSFVELLGRVREVTVGAFAHQELPFEKLFDELRPERSLSNTPLLQALFVLQNAPQPPLALPGLTLTPLDLDTGTARFDLTLFAADTARGLKATVQYSTDLFDAHTIEMMLARYVTLLGSIVECPDARLGELEFVGEEERERQALAVRRETESTFVRLRSSVPTPLTLTAEALIRRSFFENESIPLVCEPAFDDCDLVEWASDNVGLVQEMLLAHGAVLFRGFGLYSLSEFERFAQAVCPELFEENGELERTHISGRVYSPVDYPHDKAILWHNENSFAPRWPLKLCFYCARPAASGGETPIADSRRVFQLISPRVRELFAEKQIMYLRNYRPELGLSWQAVFKTDKKSEVEDYCRRFSLDFQWKSDDHLTTRSVRPAVAKHPRTGELVWFNQATHWHTSCLDAVTRRSLQALFKEDDLPRQCFYGDGSPIEDSVMEEICEVYRRIEVAFPWRKGDVLLLDNMLTAHARRPYQGPRHIAVTMGEMVTDEDIL